MDHPSFLQKDNTFVAPGPAPSRHRASLTSRGCSEHGFCCAWVNLGGWCLASVSRFDGPHGAGPGTCLALGGLLSLQPSPSISAIKIIVRRRMFLEDVLALGRHKDISVVTGRRDDTPST